MPRKVWDEISYPSPNVNGCWIRNCSSVMELQSKHVSTVYPKKYAHGFVVLCFVVAMQSFIMNSHEVFIHIHQGCFAGTGAIVRLPHCQWSKPDGYGKISQCITTAKHSKAKTVCILLGIYCKRCPWGDEMVLDKKRKGTLRGPWWTILTLVQLTHDIRVCTHV